ncbi:NAD(P)H-dependent oxidoreductase [Actinopolymorpha sp. B17G11]|uniref:NADPH-dependent FMN reductase n=1 Tax=unclassified Actinopolymorpha TaxID=2627063 RepID=UPI0032D8CA69
MTHQPSAAFDGSNPGIVVVCGNPKSQSRTLTVAQRLAGRLSERLPGLLAERLTDEADLAGSATIDLATLGGAVIDGSPDVDEALATARSARVLVVATPIYKASYTGLLKAFLDRFGGGALTGIIAIPLTVSASPIHRLAADVHLRPLLIELGASVPTRALAIEESQLAAIHDAVESWIASEAPLIRDVLPGLAAVRA